MKLLVKWFVTGVILTNALVLPVAADSAVEKIRTALGKAMPDLKVPKGAIQPSPMSGLYMVVVPPDLFYISADGRFLFDGELIDVNTRANLSEVVRGKMRLSVLDSVKEKDMIIYGSKKAKHTVTVFTDIDCGYCRKLHSEIGKYNKAGIRVRYMAFPRAGRGSDSYSKAVSVWCADDRAKAMTEAKNGSAIVSKTCSNPVDMEYKLGSELGVRGTPSIITDKGIMIPGYVPAERLKVILDQQSN